MGFFSNRRNKIIEKEIENALLFGEGYHETKIYWQAFERFAQEHGGTTDKHADGGQDTGFEMITNGIEVKVMAIRDRFNGTADIKVQTLADFKKEADKFAADFAIKARGGIPKDEEIEDEDEDEFEDEDEYETDIPSLEELNAKRDEELAEVEDEDKDEVEDVKDGEHIDYYENGQKRWEGSYKDGKPEGKCISYYDNGQKEREWTFKSWPNADGKSISWFVNGQKQKQGKYKDGQIIGTWTFWYENGQKSEQREYKNGKQHGKETWWQPDGQLMGKALWKNGKEVG